MEIAVFEKFLKDHIKVDNKTNNLGSTVSVVREKAKLSVHSDVAMSKRYMKYLTKKCVCPPSGVARGAPAASGSC